MDNKPTLLRVDGSTLTRANDYLPIPLKDKQVVIKLSQEGNYVTVKRGKDISVFHQRYFLPV